MIPSPKFLSSEIGQASGVRSAPYRLSPRPCGFRPAAAGFAVTTVHAGPAYGAGVLGEKSTLGACWAPCTASKKGLDLTPARAAKNEPQNERT